MFQASPSTRATAAMPTPSTLRATTASKVALRCWRRPPYRVARAGPARPLVPSTRRRRQTSHKLAWAKRCCAVFQNRPRHELEKLGRATPDEDVLGRHTVMFGDRIDDRVDVVVAVLLTRTSCRFPSRSSTSPCSGDTPDSRASAQRVAAMTTRGSIRRRWAVLLCSERHSRRSSSRPK